MSETKELKKRNRESSFGGEVGSFIERLLFQRARVPPALVYTMRCMRGALHTHMDGVARTGVGLGLGAAAAAAADTGRSKGSSVGHPRANAACVPNATVPAKTDPPPPHAHSHHLGSPKLSVESMHWKREAAREGCEETPLDPLRICDDTALAGHLSLESGVPPATQCKGADSPCCSVRLAARLVGWTPWFFSSAAELLNSILESRYDGMACTRALQPLSVRGQRPRLHALLGATRR